MSRKKHKDIVIEPPTDNALLYYSHWTGLQKAAEEYEFDAFRRVMNELWGKMSLTDKKDFRNLSETYENKKSKSKS